jgi:hypothetical protein
MGYLEKLLTTDTFVGWYSKWNNFADASSPTGSGVVEFHDIQITGDVYFGTNSLSILYRKEIEAYYLDLTSAPIVNTVLERKCSQFRADSANIITFDFNFVNFHQYNENKVISIGYSMDSSQSANVVLHADYWIAKSNTVMSDTATGTSRITMTANPIANIYDINNELTILGGDITSRDDFCYVKLSRLGDNPADTHTGLLNLFDIKII